MDRFREGIPELRGLAAEGMAGNSGVIKKINGLGGGCLEYISITSRAKWPVSLQ